MWNNEHETQLRSLEERVAQRNGELDSSELELLDVLETGENTPDIINRLKKVRDNHEYWTEHYEEPEDFETLID